MVATLAVTSPLLLVQSVPAFLVERAPGAVLPGISLLLAAASCCVLVLALVRPGIPDRRWLLVAALAVLATVALERYQIRTVLPAGYTPWLAVSACIALPVMAVGTERWRLAGAGSATVILGLVWTYAGRVAPGHLVVDVVSLALLAAGLIGGVRAVRRRADGADEAQRAAHDRFERSRRQLALEEERVRTDALLHDSVLTTLLIAAAGGESPERTEAMARNALDVVSGVRGEPRERNRSETFEHAVAAVEREFAPMRGLVQLDLHAAHGVELPGRVADTLVAAMLQALSNSIKHAGPMAARVARAAPSGQGGIRITVRDDGKGFDVTGIAPERLGVRVSILERVRLIGGVAEIRSTPGVGTTVLLEWTPQTAEGPAADARSAVLT
jgi:signal transduction histidine kinase